ncbi:MAG: DUF2933 domain-containing protein [Thiogranum sp.]|nr:DUF2933 domain-containing protein [Thiogranum sp.]
MSEHDHAPRGSPPPGSFWRSRAGMVLIGFAAIAGLLLAYEHRVHLFTGNGLLLVFLALCIGMHFFMHGGHGADGGGSRDEGDRP